MSNDAKKVGRRDTLKLATAATALSAGLGVVLDAGEAVAAETVKLKANALGSLSAKLYKDLPDGKGSELIATVDLSAFAGKWRGNAGNYTVKMCEVALKGDGSVRVLSEQPIQLELPLQERAPAAPVAPVAPALKR